MRKNRKGFTLIELIVVCLIIGILAAFGIPSYIKSVETSKADDAAAVAVMVATTNRMFYVDHSNTYAAGLLQDATSGCNGTGCPTSGFNGCSLVACKYMATQDWDAKAYNVFACDAAGSCPAGCAAAAVSCVKRKTTGSNSTGVSPYSGWGYYVDGNGVITTIGGSPTPVQ